MFEFLRGKLIENNLSYAVIDVGGIGYKVWTPANTILFSLNETCTLYVSLVVRENSQALYGFFDKSSKILFETLIQISGIGPKIALCILSQFSPDSFKDAIISENTALIASVPGLGKKTAEKITLDLKDKLLKQTFIKNSSHSRIPHHNYDAIQALVNLGYSEKNACKVIEKVIKDNPQEMSLSEMITEALRCR